MKECKDCQKFKDFKACKDFGSAENGKKAWNVKFAKNQGRWTMQNMERIK